MKKTYEKEDHKKNSIAAASSFSSTHSMQPPAFASTSIKASSQNMAFSQTASNTSAQQDTEEINEHQNVEEDSMQGVATLSENQLLNAVQTGHEVMKQNSTLVGARVSGSRAYSNPGCLSSPNVKSIIEAQLSSFFNLNENRILSKAVAKVLGKYLDKWTEGFHIPHLFMYPLFDNFPGPMAPPMPNIPKTLKSAPSVYEFFLTNKNNMVREIMQELPSEMDNDINRNTVERFGEKAVSYFDHWLSSSYLTGLLAKGHVPAFRPPFSFSGPVYGHIIPKSNVFS